MINKQNDITDQYIVLQYKEIWYCFPFNILEDEEPFMDLIYRSLGFASSKFPVGADIEIRTSFLRLIDKGPQKVIFDFFSWHRDPYGEMTRFIDSHHDQFNPVLNVCQLY